MMWKRSARQAVCASAIFLSAMSVSCDTGRSGTASLSSRHAPLGEGVVIRVGSQEIRDASLAYIAGAQGIAISEARDLALRDALFAAEAEALGLRATPEFDAALRGVLSRLMLRALYLEASQGEIEDQELEEATARRWLELDRPVGFRTVHAVVRFKKKDDSARRAKATELAQTIRRTLVAELSGEVAKPPGGEEQSEQSSPLSATPLSASVEEQWIDQFRKTVGTVPDEGFQILVEALPPVTADGRVIEPGGSTFAKEFSEAASKLMQRGEISPVVVTAFGAHVMMLLEQTPAFTMEQNERKKIVRKDVIAARVRALRKAIRREKLGEASVSDPSVDALLALVPIGQ